LIIAYLKTRPKFADNTDLLDRAKKFLLPLTGVTGEPINRTTEVLRNLAIAVLLHAVRQRWTIVILTS